MSSKPIKCLNWNVEWKTPRSAGGKWITQKIGELDPDVSCLTEITEALIPEGEVLRSDLDYGYENKGDRRKVIGNPLMSAPAGRTANPGRII